MALYFRHDRIRPFQKELMNDMCDAISNKQNFMAQAPTGLGKCISGESLVFTSRGLVLAKDLHKESVNSLSEHAQKINLQTGFKVKLGKEKIIKIKTRHGYEIKSTHSHKFLTRNGWKKADTLKCGERIASTRKLVITEKSPSVFLFESPSPYAHNTKIYPIHFTPNIAYLVGAFIGDGSFNSKIRIRFTLKSEEIIRNISIAISELGLVMKKYKTSNYHVDSIVLKKFLEQYGSPDIRIGKKGGKCANVYLPNELIVSPKKIFSNFLRGLFDTDGYVEKSNVVCLTSKSERLVKTLKFGLLRFGIISQTGLKINKKYGKYYILRITDRRSLIRFQKFVGFTVKFKKLRLENLLAKLANKNQNPNLDTFEFDKPFLLKLRALLPWNSNLYDSLCEYPVGNKHPTRYTLDLLIRYLHKFHPHSNLISQLETTLDSDVLWDEITEITPMPEEEVYDFSVPGVKNFVAEGIIAHNSDASISAALSHALENNLTVFFLTPKISQHKIAMEVVNGIAKKHSLPIRAVDLIGRSHCCIDDNLKELDHDGFHTSCSKKRKDKTCPFYTNAHGYSKFEQAKADYRFNTILKDYNSGKGHHELIQSGRKSECCPYEWLLKLSSISDVVIADYYHLLVPHISGPFLTKIKKQIDRSIVIVDEAHNLASRIRSSMSRNISSFTFARAVKEMRSLKFDPRSLDDNFENWANSLIGNSNERTINVDDLNVFPAGFGGTRDELAAKLYDLGYLFIERSGKKSACLRLATFFMEWENNDTTSVRILRKYGGKFFLAKKMLDPSPTTNVLNQFSSSILMSGTLLPLEMHRDILGLDPEKTIMKAYSSPFDSNNAVNIITKDITTRYSKRGTECYLKIAKKIDAIVAKTPGGTAIFFPSYKVMSEVFPYLFSQNLHIQKPDMKPPDIRQLIKKFKNGGVLCGVQGGSLSEGVDYCDGEIKTIIVVGVALDEMGLEVKALIDYYDKKFNRGWDYGYIYPGTLKALQAAGRARRKESDRVAIVYMDERFKWPKYGVVFEPETQFVVTDEPEKIVEKFWKND
ncbi:MAG: helicase C-terminal domain-containing protein [Candidatus Micrarchaeota archaeon]